MKKLTILLFALSLILGLLPALAEDTGLLDTLITGIESFDPEIEELLEIPENDPSKATITDKTDISAPNLANCNVTYAQLGTDARSTYLPTAALLLDAYNYRGWDCSSTNMAVYAGKNTYWKQWMVVVLDYTHDIVPQLWWTPGLSTAEYYRYGDDSGEWTVNEFLNSSDVDDLDNLVRLSNSTLTTYLNQLTGNSRRPLQVGTVSFRISDDKQHIYVDRPSISGGSGNYTIAYNIYDNNSNPVNYFYSNEAHVAATPGYGGLFNVFIVVTDTETKESNTQNIGWQTINWPYASKLTVGKPSFSISDDGRSIFITRPSIACKSGTVTVAYNIYDSNSKPVNYFYSTQSRVAATPGYTGKFNVYIVVRDTKTGEEVIQYTGWQQLGTTSGTYRGLILVETAVPNASATPELRYDMQNVAAALAKVNGGAYSGRIVTKQNLTYTQVRSAISSAYSGASAGDVSFFFLGTHGDTRNRQETSTEEYEGAPATADYSIPLNVLASWLSSANPNNPVIVVLSFCGSGAAVKGMSNQDYELQVREALAAFAAADTGIYAEKEIVGADGQVEKRREFCVANKFYVLTAADVYDSSYGNSSGSLMGKAVVDSMTISGSYMKADANRDKKVTFTEWYEYVYNYCYQYNIELNDGSIVKQRVQRYPTSSNYTVFWN